jgi:hypothetical protein
MPRKPPPNRKAPADKKGVRLNVKLSEADRAKLNEQARKAGYKSVAGYLRALATRDRNGLALPDYDFNQGVSDL